MKIGSKILTVLLCVALIPFLGINVYDITTDQTDKAYESEQRMLLVANDFAHICGDYFTTAKIAIEQLSIDPRIVNNCVIANNTDIMVLWDSYEGANWDNEANNKSNKAALDWDTSNDLDAEFSEFLNELSIMDNFGEIFISDDRGYVWASTESVPGDFYQFGEGWWVEAEENGGFYSNFDFDDSVNAFVLEIVYQVRNLTSDEPVGMIKAGFNVDSLLPIIEEVQSHMNLTDIKMFAFGHEGKIIIHNDDELVGTDIHEYMPEEVFDNGEIIHRFIQDEHSDHADEPQSAQGEHDHEEDVLIGYGHISLAEVEYWGSYSLIHEWDILFIAAEPKANVDALIAAQTVQSLIMIGIVTLIVIAAAILFSRSITKPIQILHQATSEIEKGNYKVQVSLQSTDELGILATNFNSMVSKVKTTIQNSKKVSAQLSASAEELSSSAEEVSASSENIASSQQQISKGASNQVLAISDTQKQFVEFTSGVRDIREKVDKIGEVAEMISSIANQTNMLALNAAIEAARAGEAGRGFNVVAEQVRKLADESKRAVLQTNNMLNEISSITLKQEKNAVDMLKSIDGIATVAEETSASTEESAAAAEEQASSMEMITSTAQQLMSLAEMLVGEFKDIQIEDDLVQFSAESKPPQGGSTESTEKESEASEPLEKYLSPSDTKKDPILKRKASPRTKQKAEIKPTTEPIPGSETESAF